MNYIRHITALGLSALMFLTSVGFSIDMHYCQGQLKSYSLMGKAKSCHSVDKAKVTCPHHQKMAAKPKGSDLAKKDCCSNKTLHFQLDQGQKAHEADFSFQNHLPTLAVPVSIFTWYAPNWTNSIYGFVFYEPPLITKDQIVLKQSFLL
ncbi:MAG: hypothetical protein IPL46_15785 [Saprospiraceae bacterium]|nr:hypothetical protein [Saprospiraceae bacterium]